MRKRASSILRRGLVVVAAIGLGIGATVAWNTWRPEPDASHVDSVAEESQPSSAAVEPKTVRLSRQARKNLGLTSQAVRIEDYWRKVQIPGMLVHRTGQSDRAVTSPAASVVERVYAFEGDTVAPGAPLLRLRLFSEQLQDTQSELFTAAREIELLQEQHQRLRSAVEEGAVAQSRLIELENQLRRQEVLVQAARQELLTGGLTAAQIEQAADGNFISAIDVVAPPTHVRESEQSDVERAAYLPLVSGNGEQSESVQSASLAWEVQELKVELGQQVQAGQLLVQLANHRLLYIEGHAFKQESPYLERAAAEGRAIEVEFAEDAPNSWPALEQTFEIRHLSNSIDPTSRTFAFYIPLINQSRAYKSDGETFLVWRFRPGQRVRLLVPVERFEDVIVVPREAVVREGPDAFVFRQNGDLFDRVAVHVLHEDRSKIVIANDGSIAPGLFLAQHSAASLNRVLKAQSASGLPANVHVHADGTVHGAH